MAGDSAKTAAATASADTLAVWYTILVTVPARLFDTGPAWCGRRLTYRKVSFSVLPFNTSYRVLLSLRLVLSLIFANVLSIRFT